MTRCEHCGNPITGEPEDLTQWRHRGVSGSFCSLGCVVSEIYVIETAQNVRSIRASTGLPVALGTIPVSLVEKEHLKRDSKGRLLLAKAKRAEKAAALKWRREGIEAVKRVRARRQKIMERRQREAKAQEQRRSREMYREVVNPSDKTYCHHCIENDATCQLKLGGRMTPLCDRCSGAIVGEPTPYSVGFLSLGDELPFPTGPVPRKPMLHELDEKLGEPVPNHGFMVITQDLELDVIGQRIMRNR